MGQDRREGKTVSRDFMLSLKIDGQGKLIKYVIFRCLDYKKDAERKCGSRL